MRLGVVVAHPDDEVLGCGGTLAKYNRQGIDAHVLIIGAGADYQDAPSAANVFDASRLLGVNVIFGHEPPPDNAFDTVSLLEIVRKVSAWIRDTKVTHVLTHSPACLNIDHRIVCQAVVTATRPRTSTVDAVYAFETPSATEWSIAQLPWRPSRYEVLTESDVDRKLKAMACYPTESKEYPHARSPEMLRARMQVAGAAAGCEYAEPFIVLRETVR